MTATGPEYPDPSQRKVPNEDKTGRAQKRNGMLKPAAKVSKKERLSRLAAKGVQVERRT